MSYSGRGQRAGAPRGGGSSRGGRGGPPGQGGPSRGAHTTSAGGSDTGSSRGFSQRGGYAGGPGRGGGGGGFRSGPPPGPVIFKQNTPAQVPPRLSDSNLQSLVSSFDTLRVTPGTTTPAPIPERPPRPGYGTQGIPITLRANFFAVKIAKGQKFWDYVVSISGPRSEKEGIKIRIFELLELHPQCKRYVPHIAHDRSARLVSAKELPQPLVVNIEYYDENRQGPAANADEYSVEIRLERVLDTNELNRYSIKTCSLDGVFLTQYHDRYLDGVPDARSYDLGPLSSALNMITQSFGARHGRRVGRAFSKYFYDTPTKPVSLSPNLEAWQGFALSIRPAFKQLMINVYVSSISPFVAHHSSTTENTILETYACPRSSPQATWQTSCLSSTANHRVRCPPSPAKWSRVSKSAQRTWATRRNYSKSCPPLPVTHTSKGTGKRSA